MRLSSQLSRVEMLACVQAYGMEHLEDCATALGYVRRAAAPLSLTLDESETREAPVPTEMSTSRIATPEAPAQVRFARVVAQRQLAAAEVVREAPLWFRNAVPYDTEVRANPALRPPPQQPLLPWPRLWPFLRLVLGVLAPTHRPDLPRVVALLARGQFLRQVPRLQQQRWAPTCQVVIDYAPPLRPFWSDCNVLHTRLQRLRGVHGLQLLALPDGEPGGRCAVYTPQGWRAVESYHLPAPGTPVLVLSDLGCLDSTDVRRRQWRRLGRRLRRAGCQPVALMPCPPRWWDEALTPFFTPVCWDRGVRLPRYRGVTRRRSVPGQVAEPDARTEQLLGLLGRAIRVEPALLRAVRYALPVQVDVGSEATAWNHAQVHATPLVFYYDHEAIAHYRAAFAAQPEGLRRQVAHLLLAHHAHLSPAIGSEEALLLAESVPVSAAGQAQEFLARLAQTLWQQDGAFAASAQDWCQRLGRRQREHEQLWRRYDALCAVWAMANRAALRAGIPLTLPQGFDVARVSWVLASDPRPRQYVLRQRGHLLYVEAADPTPEAGREVPGSPLARLSAAAPYVQVSPSPAASAESTTYGLGQGMPLAPDTVLHLRTDAQKLTIDSMARPAWAESIGRDAQGLFATWAAGQRRAYWVPPGRYPVSNGSGTALGDLEITSGYWGDAAEALTLLREGFRQPVWATAYGVDDYGLYAECSVAGVVQRMRWMAPGEFVMGSPVDEPTRYDDEEQHAVLLTRGFWLADTTCTQALWQAVMGSNPSELKGAERPVERVSWEDVQGFLGRLNTVLADSGFRLPTEAEWEYACRAGTTTPFWFGAQITPEQVNYAGNYPYADGPQGLYRQETVPVQALPCNAWGLYQMHGNVWEWCQDWKATYPAGLALDPVGPETGEIRVLRGGGWINDAGLVRSAFRSAYPPGHRIDVIGFRLARGQGHIQARPEAQGAPREQGRAGERRPGARGGE